MEKFLENLRAKPEHIKSRIAFVVSFSFTFLVFAGWIASYGFNSSAIIAENKVEDDGTVTVIETPVSSLSATAIGAWDDFKDFFKSSNKIEYSKDSVQIEAGSM